MDHLAIVRQPFFGMILSGEKSIESRWYRSRKAPFGNIRAGETVYLKEPGKPVSAKCEVEKALFFEHLDKAKIEGIIKKYGSRIGISLSRLGMVKDKKFCTLIFIKNVRRLKTFKISKKGHGNMCAWITLKNIGDIKTE